MHTSYTINTTIPLVLQKLTDETLHSKLVELTSRGPTQTVFANGLSQFL
jgi:hypothetical protein